MDKYNLEVGDTFKIVDAYKTLDLNTPSQVFFKKNHCDKVDTKSAKIILKTFIKKPIYYHSCIHGICACARRSMAYKPQFCLFMKKEYLTYLKDVYMPRIFELLANFTYDFNYWYNNLTSTQQMEIDKNKTEVEIEFEKIMAIFKGFLKSEKQLEGDKIRQIGAPTWIHKYVLGPIFKELEKYLRKGLKGWGIGKSYTDKEQLLNEWESEGFIHSLTTDISGLDQSHNELIRQPFIQIMNYLVDNKMIHHIPEGVFKAFALNEISTVRYSKNIQGEQRPIVELNLKEKLASGNAATSLINTLAVDSVLSFAFYRKGIEVRKCTSGDDSMIAVKDLRGVENALAEVFNQKGKEDIPHGLGLVLKYVRVGTLEDVTPCSTEVFKCQDCGYKMIRQLDRFFNFTCISDKAMTLSDKQLLHYKHLIKITEESWCKGMPLIQPIMDMLNYDKYDPQAFNKLVKPKSYKPTDFTPHIIENFDVSEELLIALMGKAYLYSQRDRISIKLPCCNRAFLNRLEIKYGLTEQDTINIVEHIKNNQINYEPSDVMTNLLKTGETYLEKLILIPKIDWNIELNTALHAYIPSNNYFTNVETEQSDDLKFYTLICKRKHNWNSLNVLLKFLSIVDKQYCEKSIIELLLGKGFIKTLPRQKINMYPVKPENALSIADLTHIIEYLGYVVNDIGILENKLDRIVIMQHEPVIKSLNTIPQKDGTTDIIIEHKVYTTIEQVEKHKEIVDILSEREHQQHYNPEIINFNKLRETTDYLNKMDDFQTGPQLHIKQDNKPIIEQPIGDRAEDLLLDIAKIDEDFNKIAIDIKEEALLDGLLDEPDEEQELNNQCVEEFQAITDIQALNIDGKSQYLFKNTTCVSSLDKMLFIMGVLNYDQTHLWVCNCQNFGVVQGFSYNYIKKHNPCNVCNPDTEHYDDSNAYQLAGSDQINFSNSRFLTVEGKQYFNQAVETTQEHMDFPGIVFVAGQNVNIDEEM
jgi:hypothetical protein